MQRVETLSNTLLEKIKNKASIKELLVTVKMIESELQHLKTITVSNIEEELSTFNLPFQKKIDTNIDLINENITEEKTVEILQIDETELEAELEEIKRNAAEREKIIHNNKPAFVLNDIDEIPTMKGILNDELLKNTRQDITVNETVIHETKPENIYDDIVEINELPTNNLPTSLNEKLASTKLELSDSLAETPIKDLKKAIGINEHFLYLNELFRGDEAMYERSIKTINAFEIYPEAEFWIRRELKLKLGWDDKYQTVKQFDQLVRRRFA